MCKAITNQIGMPKMTADQNISSEPENTRLAPRNSNLIKAAMAEEMLFKQAKEQTDERPGCTTR
jgi:hypothetical protein